MSGLDLDGLLSVPEAAELLRVSEACIRAWLSRGRLPRIKAGRRTLISKASLRALLQVTQPVRAGVGGGAAPRFSSVV